MKALLNKSITICFILFVSLSACRKDVNGSEGPGNTGGAKPHVVMGDIYDANGNKFQFPGAAVTVGIWGPGDIGNHTVSYNIAMDANSHYEQKVADGIYAFHASALMPLNGNKIRVDLQSLDNIPAHIQQASAPGIVKNFALVLSGLGKVGDASDANSYFGGHICVGDGVGFFGDYGYWNNLKVKYPGSTITFTLTPKGSCVDGSDAPLKQITCTVDDLETGKYLVNFPYAWYQLSAVLTTANGAQKNLVLSFIPDDSGTTHNYLDVTFPPDPASMDNYPLNPQIAVWEQ